ncbi:MAG TPA: FkbM family methyltransferase [Acidimicrobiales bacterium]|nr:FkbM family methyltransferase [Acidimicrobiales bacterium]
MASYRFLRTGVNRLFPDRFVPVPTRSGWLRLNPHRDPSVLTRVLRWYERDMYRNIGWLLPPGGYMVDVGANMGEFTIWAAKKGGRGARVLAVEADPDNARWLEENVRRSGMGDRVRTLSVAAAEADGEADLILSPHLGLHTLVESRLHQEDFYRPIGTRRIRTRPLDDLVEEAGWGPPDVVKVDVEGAELSVLAGAARLLGSDAPLVLLIDLHAGVDVASLTNLLHRHGFTIRKEETPDEVIEAVGPEIRSIVALRHRALPPVRA